MSLELGEQNARALDARKVSAKERGGTLANALRDVRLLLIALWLGGAVYFSFVVAPGAFGVLRERNAPNANELAGSIVTRTLSVINTSGFIISLLLLASAFLLSRIVSRRAFYAELVTLVVIAVTTGTGQWVINAKLLALRLAMGRPIDLVDKDDPLRVAFNSLHGYSVTALGVGMLAGIVALLLIARRVRAESN